MVNKYKIAEDLLTWYDINARELPWRIPPLVSKAGVLPNPYYIWMSEVMLQQTTVAAVKEYFLKFVALWPTVFDMANAKDEDVMAAWAGLGYYARARNLLKCARVIKNQYDGKFPSNEKDLLSLPGIGPYTAAAIMSIAFNKKAIVLDGNIERVMSRIYAVQEPLPASKKALWLLASDLTPENRCGDYAQAVMDLGATICTPRKPKCSICPWNYNCEGLLRGIADGLPNKTPKLKKQTRVGTAYVAIRNDRSILLERRSEKGLLGGMLGWPGSDWNITPTDHLIPLDADWHTLNETVRHTFTHFHLELTVKVASNVKSTPRIGKFLTKEDFKPNDLPTVMRKVWIKASKFLAK